MLIKNEKTKTIITELVFRVNTRRWRNAGLMLDQRLRRWPNIKPALRQPLVLAGLLSIFPSQYNNVCMHGVPTFSFVHRGCPVYQGVNRDVWRGEADYRSDQHSKAVVSGGQRPPVGDVLMWLLAQPVVRGWGVTRRVTSTCVQRDWWVVTTS